MGFIKYILVRAAVSLVVASAALLIFVIAPHQHANNQVDDHAEQVASAVGALKVYRNIEALPDPNTLKVQTKNEARKYSQEVSEVLPALNTKVPDRPPVVTARLQGNKIERYNAIIRDNQYGVVLENTRTALATGNAFATHHYQVMRALTNILEYNPTEDTENSERQIVEANLKAAGGGFERTIQRVREAPKFDDPTLAEIFSSINRAETARKTYEEVIANQQPFGNQRQLYIEEVTATQQLILQNRQAFWVKNKAPITRTLNNARRDLQAYNTLFSNL